MKTHEYGVKGLDPVLPPALERRVAEALDAGCIWSEGSEGHARMVKTKADFDAWRNAGAPEVDAVRWPDQRNRGLLQAAKQALRALEQHRRLPWGQPEYPTPNPGAHFIYEAQSYLRPAIEREEAWRSAVPAAGAKTCDGSNP